MPCGAILTFETQVDSEIRGLWHGIADAGFPSSMPGLDTPPHLTLLACEEIDLTGLKKAGFDEFMAAQAAVPVEFPGLGIFTGPLPVIYLAAAPAIRLLALHSAFWDLVAPFCRGLNEYYAPGTWVPHVTLDHTFPINQTGAIIQALLGMTIPAQGTLSFLHLMHLCDSPNALFTYRLQSTDSSKGSIS